MIGPGTVTGRYEVREVLGYGGFATVYRAHDLRLDREVALKALLPRFAQDADAEQRFNAEARALARLRHATIVTIYDVDAFDGQPYFAMELIHGQTLTAMLANDGPLSPVLIAHVLSGVADAIDYLHGAGIVHRDVKPDNVMVEDAGRVVLMDLGIARTLTTTSATRAGTQLGTVGYAAPEQIRGSPIGPAADIYAFAVLAYHLLAGRPPFRGTTAHVLYAHAHEPPPSVRELRPDLPPSLDHAIQTGLAKEPDQRPASAKEFAGLIASALGSITASRPAPPSGTTNAMTLPPTAPVALGTLGNPSPPSAPPLAPTTKVATASYRKRGMRISRRGALALVVAAAGALAGGVGAVIVATRGGHARPTSTPAGVTILPTTGVAPPPTAAAPSQTPAYSVPLMVSPTAEPGEGVATATPSPVPALEVTASAPTPSPVASTPRPASQPLVWTSRTLAGSGASGFQDGPGATARFAYPQGVAVDAGGNVYVPDLQNHRIRKIAPDGTVSTLAGSGQPGLADGIGAAARFNYPAGIAVDGAGSVFVSDYFNHRIRKVTPDGHVATLAGSGPSGREAGGFADGPGGTARFNLPAGLAVDSAGNVYVADLQNNRVRRVAPDGVVSTIAGSGSAGFADGPADAALFDDTAGVAVDAVGNVYIADFNNNRIRKISPTGQVTTLAGANAQGLADGAGGAARFNGPTRIAADRSGTLFVADLNNNAIRRVTPNGDVTTVAGDGVAGYQEGRGPAARFNHPEGVAVDATDVIYVADAANGRIRRLTPA